jgi:hypothetical protein
MNDQLEDRTVLDLGRTPHDKQNRNCLDYSQNLVMSPRGAQCQGGPTDWPTDRQTDRQLQRNSDSNSDGRKQ